ncbi:hypothetical protein K388_06678 [Streptomyces sp. KhCrAH-43]|uniref:Secreted protein n=1 Tax=Streptomyces tropicalis TaxID=3034234 RepID=A0ABT6AEI0_9ACTN|nr:MULTISPECIES: hypothetical protein [Streptomyces]MDF3303039.1 hypothetical protein [Streptomyces tropicalis]MYS33429.1 hypothetical protein [Streptomyces sp. SID4920]MYX64013.1 hypothetical protein [Streptomyces sp. SID8373]RAJ49760.1 hypothetical protein K388_06678 [Streptomyces sp. KhCrAH-43]
MPAFKRTAVTLLAAAAVTGTTLATATTASAADYRCKTSSSATYDDPSYDGPDSDNWSFDVKLCAKRSGGYIYTTATVYWDGPYSSGTNNHFTFNKARFHLQTKKSARGTDPVVKYANYTGLEGALENSSSSGNGSYMTGTIKTKATAASYLADGYIQLDWSGDGKDYKSPILFSASPTV